MNVQQIARALPHQASMTVQLGIVGLHVWGSVVALTVMGVPWAHAALGVVWPAQAEGPLFLTSLVGATVFAAVLVEGRLRRWPSRGAWAVVGAAGAAGATLAALAVNASMMRLAGTGTEPFGAVVSLRSHLLAWLGAGLCAGLLPWVVRILRGRGTAATAVTWPEATAEFWAQAGGGLAAGGFAAAVWHAAGYYPTLGGDLFLASAGAAVVFGAVHGRLCWEIPPALHTGTLRVARGAQAGEILRIAVPEHGIREHFVGCYPEGLDLTLPAHNGVAELHVSVIVDPAGRFAVRGLADKRTTLLRPLERIDLTYDATAPVPVEVPLRSGDRIVLGAAAAAVLVFDMHARGAA